MVAKDDIRKALEVVIDPELHRSIVELDMVRSIEASPNGVVDVTVSLTTPGCPIKGHFQTAVADAVAKLDGVTHVNVFFDVLSDEQKASAAAEARPRRPAAGRRSRPGRQRDLRRLRQGRRRQVDADGQPRRRAGRPKGKRVGVLDADVWGYSIPRMYGLGSTRPAVSRAAQDHPAARRTA